MHYVAQGMILIGSLMMIGAGGALLRLRWLEMHKPELGSHKLPVIAARPGGAVVGYDYPKRLHEQQKDVPHD